MYRTHTCGALRIENVNENVCLSGWVQKIRNLGAMTFIDLRDRYGITQLVAEESASEEIKKQVAQLGFKFKVRWWREPVKTIKYLQERSKLS